jgi:hypothetical protein
MRVSHMLVERRDFIRWSVVIGAAHALHASARPRVYVVVNHLSGGTNTPGDVRRGVLMGVEEAEHAAALFGGAIAVRGPGSNGDVAPAASVIPVWIVESTADPAARRDLMRRGSAVVFNADDAGNDLRHCDREVFHIAPRGAAGAMWDSSLTRFGADTLNKRFQSRFGSAMTAPAWAGWFAVKCVWEATLKSKATSAAGVVAWMERPSSRFDGHKGAPLYFDGAHELVQPLYGKDGREITPEPRGARCDWKS